MRLKRFDQINLIPFIDIMLVLLVIVLTTATFIAKGSLKVELPSAKNSKELPLKKVEITITKEGNFFFNNEKIALSQLEEKLQPLSTKSFILIRSDKNTPFEFFIKLLDTLKTHHFENIAVETLKAEN